MKYTVIIFLIFITSCRSQNISDQDKYYQEIHKILNVSFGENTKVIMPNKFSFSNRIDLSKNHLYDSLLVSYKKNKLILASLLKNKDDETVYNKQLWFENKNLTIDKLNIKSNAATIYAALINPLENSIRASYRLNIFNMRLVTIKPPTMLIVAINTAIAANA